MKAPRLLARRAAAVALAGLVLTLIAFLFDSSPLFVPGIALVLIGAVAPAWVWASARGAVAQRHLEAERVVEEQTLAATIEVRRSRLGLPGAEVVDPFTGSRLELGGPLSPFRGGRIANVRVVTRFPRRGLHDLAPPALVVRDRLDSGTGRSLRLPDGRSPAEAFAAVDVDGLRPYRPGTSASRIYWPAVARGAGLIERRLRADGDTRPLVVLDARDSSARPTLVDAAVRAAASLTLEFARLAGCGLLLPGEQRVTAVDRELSTWPAAIARLALVEGGPDAKPPALGPAGGRLGPMIYVAARPPERLAALNGDGG